MDCVNAVYSDEYYDLIVETDNQRERYALPPCLQEIDSRYVVGYWPREGLPPFQVTNYTYTAIPKLFTTLDELSMEASGITQLQNQPTLSLKGQGVLIGIIDTGIDYQNPLFRNADGSTRIAAVWDQTRREGPAPEHFLYGAEYRAERIDEALSSENPLTVVPVTDENGHGTYVASLAAGGEDPGRAFVGAAPYAAIGVVKLKEAKPFLRDFFFVGEETAAFQENDIMAGAAYLDRLANELDMPLSLCVSLGTNWGSHGGVSPLSGVLDGLVRKRKRSVSVAAGNEANRRHHYRGVVAENGAFDNVEINVGEDMPGFTLELWSLVSETFTVEIVSPTGERIPRLSPQNVRREYTFIFENTRVSVDKNISFASNDLQLIFMRFAAPSPGIWNIRVYGENVFRGEYHMWLPLEALLGGEVFFLNSNPDTTFTVPGGARFPMTVGGYDDRTGSIYLDSGRGYTIEGAVKPDFVAPAVGVLGAGQRNTIAPRTGTSAAAAITAGAAALLLEWAVVRGNYPRLTSGDIKGLFIRGADRDPQRQYPNREWGYGQLNLYESFSSIRTL